jgi:FKBP-type peptidyl-prolyl cis-trans isomerase (trigger factor)
VKSAEDAEAFKKDTEKHSAAAGEAAKKTLRRTFILRKIAQQEKITVGQEEINAQISNMSRYYGYKPNELRNMLEKTGGMGELELDMMNGKVLEFLAGICG